MPSAMPATMPTERRWLRGDEPFCEEDPDRHGGDDDGGEAGVESLLGPEEAGVVDGEHDEAEFGGSGASRRG